MTILFFNWSLTVEDGAKQIRRIFSGRDIFDDPSQSNPVTLERIYDFKSRVMGLAQDIFDYSEDDKYFQYTKNKYTATLNTDISKLFRVDANGKVKVEFDANFHVYYDIGEQIRKEMLENIPFFVIDNRVVEIDLTEHPKALDKINFQKNLFNLFSVLIFYQDIILFINFIKLRCDIIIDYRFEKAKKISPWS